MENKIRKLSIGLEPTQQFHYIVNGKMPVKINGVLVQKTVSEIEEKEDSYNIYLKSGNEVQLWKNIPKSNIITTEFEID